MNLLDDDGCLKKGAEDSLLDISVLLTRSRMWRFLEHIALVGFRAILTATVLQFGQAHSPRSAPDSETFNQMQSEHRQFGNTQFLCIYGLMQS